MARHRSRSRSRSRSYSPRRRSLTPPRGSKRYDDGEPRDRRRDRRDRRSPAPSGLLVRNLPLDARPEDLRVPFERYGPVKDVYLPKNYYTGEPRGFGFVKYRYADDAAEAKHKLNHTVIGGREIRIVFAEENRKTPKEMRVTARISGRHGRSHRRRTPPRRRYHSYSRSPSPVRGHRSKDNYHSSVHSQSVSRSPSHDDRGYRRSPSQSPRDDRDNRRAPSPRNGGSQSDDSGRAHGRSRSSRENGRRRSDERGRTPSRSRSPRENGRHRSDERGHTPSRSRSPRGKSHSPSRSCSRSYSPH